MNEPSPVATERQRQVPLMGRVMNRPELGAVAGTLLVFLIFFVVAGDSGMFSADGAISWMKVAAYLGIIAIGACLLMIAGEFDLSVGSMIGFAGMMIAIPAKYWGVGRFGGRFCSRLSGRCRWGLSMGILWLRRGCRRLLCRWRFCLFCAG